MNPAVPFHLCRIYDTDEAGGYRVLVDRLWPRGVRKSDAAVDEWAKDVAPSTELRRWYGHDPERFDEFARRYRTELTGDPAAAVVTRLRNMSRTRTVTLLTATRDLDHSAAKVLHEHLVRVSRRRRRVTRPKTNSGCP